MCYAHDGTGFGSILLANDIICTRYMTFNHGDKYTLLSGPTIDRQTVLALIPCEVVRRKLWILVPGNRTRIV